MPADETEGGKFMEPLKHSVFAEKSDISKPKSLLIAKLFAVGKQRGTAPVTSPILTALAYACEHTPPKSYVRKLFSRLVCIQNGLLMV